MGFYLIKLYIYLYAVLYLHSHNDMSVLPVVDVSAFFGHLIHEVFPLFDWYRPRGHGQHGAIPVLDM